MPGYDVMNGLALAGPLTFLIGIGLIYLIGTWINRE